MADEEVRRRTSFEKDLREWCLKLVVGGVLGLLLKFLTDWDGWFAPMAVGIGAVFFLASVIRGAGRWSD